MKLLQQPEIALALLAFLATTVGIRGRTWDESKRGLRRVTLTGWIAAIAAILVVCLQVSVGLTELKDAERREAARQTLRHYALTELGRIAEELRLRYISLPQAIHHYHVREAHLPESSSIDVILMGEDAGYGHWDVLRSPFARTELERKVRLTEIATNDRSLPDDLMQFMDRWSDRLDRAFGRSSDVLTDDEKVVVRAALEHEFIPELQRSLTATKSIEGFSPAHRTSVLDPGGVSFATYRSFIDAVQRLQALGTGS